MNETLSLEEFKKQRNSRNRIGKWQFLLLELNTLTPTKIPKENKEVVKLRLAIMATWRNNVQKEKGGILHSTIIKEDLWVVWYPEQSD